MTQDTTNLTSAPCESLTKYRQEKPHKPSPLYKTPGTAGRPSQRPASVFQLVSLPGLWSLLLVFQGAHALTCPPCILTCTNMYTHGHAHTLIHAHTHSQPSMHVCARGHAHVPTQAHVSHLPRSLPQSFCFLQHKAKAKCWPLRWPNRIMRWEEIPQGRVTSGSVRLG